MTQTIHKKCFPEFFESLYKGKRKSEVRLEDFRVGEGDTIIFEEWNPKTKSYTGRKTAKVCRNVMSVNPTKIYTYDKLQQFGLVLIDLEDVPERTVEYETDRMGFDRGTRVKTWADLDKDD